MVSHAADYHRERQRRPPHREILSEGSASASRQNGVNVYRWGNTRVVGLSGHVVGVDFPEEYNDWRDVEPVELIDAT